jgi:hypothetical protein
MLIRDEQAGDEDAIRQVVADAFRDHPHSDQREHFLVDALRHSGALTLSLVAEEDGAPPEFFLSLPFGPDIPTGAVEYHPSFYSPISPAPIPTPSC